MQPGSHASRCSPPSIPKPPPQPKEQRPLATNATIMSHRASVGAASKRRSQQLAPLYCFNSYLRAIIHHHPRVTLHTSTVTINEWHRSCAKYYKNATGEHMWRTAARRSPAITWYSAVHTPTPKQKIRLLVKILSQQQHHNTLKSNSPTQNCGWFGRC